MPEPFFSHSRAETQDAWELLEDHLDDVARRCAAFSADFDSSQWGYLAGLWHDIGKYQHDFQRRIRGERVQAPHAGVGAALALRTAAPLAFVIAGHHAGLANRAEKGNTKQTPLERLLSENEHILTEVLGVAPRRILQQDSPKMPAWIRATDLAEARLRAELWTRFLFSALVDADRLATEAFYEPAKRDVLTYDSIRTLRYRLDAHLDDFRLDTPVNVVRSEVLESCRRAASLTTGLFSLSVPTGGGKTLASMSFALAHAELHSLHRVIVVAPFTSIIDQNAAVYRSVLGERNVIEHHSAIDEGARDRATSEAEVRRRLAAENWDAPIVVTTAVQFLESLFSNEPSRCRKLHNITRSVVIVDEAQTLPTEFLSAVIDVMRQLTTHYGCSLVLSTATQPALTKRNALPNGLTDVREIADDPTALAAALRRVSVHWPVAETPVRFEEIAAAMAAHAQVLTIVHSRADARRLSELVPEADRYHLSTRMCAAHRLETLRRIKRALNRGDICRVVSTQLVEAGVDVSFPVVYRSMAGLDSLAQAAGRCNRNGELRGPDGQPALGHFVVFRAESKPPRGLLRRGFEVAEGMLRARGTIDLSDPATLHEYFRLLYFGSDLDARGVMAERQALNFANVAERVRLISDQAWPVVVPWGEGSARVLDFQRSLYGSPRESRQAARALQPFVVQVYEQELGLLDRQGAVAILDGFGHMLVPPFLGLYDPNFGLTLDDGSVADASALVV
jgi:CRISPR-associated endonuclease/helicase Cas3